MKTSWLAWALVIVIAISAIWLFSTRTAAAPETSNAAGINGSNDQGNVGGTDTGTVQQPGADGQEDPIIGANLALGLDGAGANRHLIGYNGMTVYMNAQDTSVSTCYDTCAVNWPPYIVSPADNIQQLQAGVEGDVGTTIRTDGQLQLTYNGHPLYFYKGDTSGSDTKGDGVGNGQWAMVAI